jgi:hypothetical protein
VSAVAVAVIAGYFVGGSVVWFLVTRHLARARNAYSLEERTLNGFIGFLAGMGWPLVLAAYFMGKVASR